MEIAMALTVLSAILYWSVVYDDMRKLFKWSNFYDRQFQLFLTLLHIMPLLSTVINYLISDVEFLKRDVTAIILVGMLYLGLNAIVSKLAGWHIYPML
jgi:hypothetical protein